uniref:Avirulence protein n=1 Tax=Peronospora matthiolae TaxID=2874970 RepID=A0AAV1TAY1_9STRA
MRFCYFVFLPSVALAIMATKSSKTSHSIVHVVSLRDVANHRNDALVNRALRALVALDDDEERWPFSTSRTQALVELIESHGSFFNDRHMMEAAIQTWYKLVEKDHVMAKLGKHYSAAPGPVHDTDGEALAYKLVTTYTDRGVARAIRHTRADTRADGTLSPEANRVIQLQDIMANHWRERGLTINDVLSNFDTKDDADFFASTAFTFFERYVKDQGNANQAIFAYFNSSPSRYFSAVLDAMAKSGANRSAIDESKKWLLRFCAKEGATLDTFENSLTFFQTGGYAPNEDSKFKELVPRQIKQLVDDFKKILPTE